MTLQYILINFCLQFTMAMGLKNINKLAKTINNNQQWTKKNNKLKTINRPKTSKTASILN